MDAPIIKISVRASTGTMRVKMNACAIVGSVWPTLSVPGMRSSGTIFQKRNSAVVGAYDPMPSVSKKFVTKPVATLAGVRRSPSRARRRPRANTNAYRAATMARTASRTSFACMGA